MSERIFVAQKTKQTGKPVQSLAKVDFTNLENKSSKKLNISIKQKITSIGYHSKITERMVQQLHGLIIIEICTCLFPAKKKKKKKIPHLSPKTSGVFGTTTQTHIFSS